MKRPRSRFKELWWLEIFLPLFLGALVWGVLTYVLYGGSVRDRLASRVEKHFIEDALGSSHYPAQSRKAITIVSLTEEDWKGQPQARLAQYRDASLAVYTKVLERILEGNPKRVFFSWLPSAHDVKDVSDENNAALAQLARVIQAKGKDTDVYLVYAAGEIGSLPASLTEAVPVLEGDDCHYEVMSYCSFWRRWSGFWVVQVLAEEFWEKSRDGIPVDHLSTNLPHTLPNYLVHLPDARSIDAMSFSDVLAGKDSSSFKGRSVFVGSALTQRVSPLHEPTALWRTFTVHDAREGGLAVSGTPYHVFWAQLAQMFTDRMTVRVINFGQEWAILLLFCVGLLLLLWRLPAPIALCYYIGGTVILMLINRVLVSRLQLYLPVFDTIYAGFFAFLYPAFAMMSYELYKRWQSSAQNLALQQSDALKTNFVSLISHNLNTPVARMQGLVDLLAVKQEARGAFEPMSILRREIVRLQLCVRAVLIGSALEDGSRHEKNVSLQKIMEEFGEGASPLLERLGVHVKAVAGPMEEDMQLLPVRVDLRVLIFSVAGLLAICGAKDLGLTWTLREEGDGTYRMSLGVRGAVDSFWKVWTADELSLGFFERTLVHFFRQFLALYGGQVQSPTAGGITLNWQVRVH